MITAKETFFLQLMFVIFYVIVNVSFNCLKSENLKKRGKKPTTKEFGSSKQRQITYD